MDLASMLCIQRRCGRHASLHVSCFARKICMVVGGCRSELHRQVPRGGRFLGIHRASGRSIFFTRWCGLRCCKRGAELVRLGTGCRHVDEATNKRTRLFALADCGAIMVFPARCPDLQERQDRQSEVV
ncbi:hypothetical protein H310_03305 [Aphanomyces invadans]|uniref:Uncharacterized protein n=1 Tax=Aphanomyces invadans TaxID=157072 RepID=A0A024UH83_9STRA|nr:hypothetical protein H310_03305 [Aphanomyces invadans]ETW05555.1 hypothetical protein H310_03305 [Aphanomyces invadans]|eukprot:XP_008865332.1 hypothetical protein H310_03305 [Aphanomyces invadans]